MAVTLNGAPEDLINSDVVITLAASATTDGMDISVQFKDRNGDNYSGVIQFELWISEASTGIGLTADVYSGDVTTVTGTEMTEITSKKHFKLLTNASGLWSGLAVASANPTDQYIAVVHPATGKVIVSEASGTYWEGA